MIPKPSSVWLDVKEIVYLPKRKAFSLTGSPVRRMQISASDWLCTSRSWLLPQRMIASTETIKRRLMQIWTIVSICEMESQLIEHITEKEVFAGMRRLKNNKAMDSLALTSEHLKLDGRDLVTSLTEF